MQIRVTPEAIAIVRRSLELAGFDPSKVGVRLRERGGQVMPRFVETPEATDETVDVDGLRIFLDRALLADGGVEIGVSDEHERLIVRPL